MAERVFEGAQKQVTKMMSDLAASMAGIRVPVKMEAPVPSCSVTGVLSDTRLSISRSIADGLLAFSRRMKSWTRLGGLVIVICIQPHDGGVAASTIACIDN
jgi:hypothetical protein